ncbi:hypothetical protein CLU79DRAFT_892499 [Phycomyces nitens]|nr:hypothetical protein CLU79DRAFT_892499 [Phycomyces nitens]
MLISHLPLDILFQIAKFLSNKDKIQCSLVNKRFSVPFQESLWEEIGIYSSSELDYICKTSETAHESAQRNLYHTKSLTLGKAVPVTDKRILLLQQTFPKLRHLCIVHYLLDQSSFGMPADWSSWESLNELFFGLSYWTISRAEKMVLDIVCSLQSLSRLTLSLNFNQDLLRFTIKDLEMLHISLCQLEYLSINTDLSPLTIDDIKTVDITVPATRLTYLKINARTTVHRWMCYFAANYPNLRTLEGLVIDEIDKTEEYQSEISSTSFPVIPHSFRHLQSFKASVDSRSALIYLSIWNHFGLSNTSLRHVGCEITGPVMDKINLVSIFKSSVEPFTNTLETLYFEYIDFEPNTNTLTTAIALDYYTCLAYLHISSEHSSVTLNPILDSCVALKALKLQARCIIIDPSAPTRSRPHGLRVLEVYHSATTAETLNYVSVQCPRLSYMWLLNTSIHGQICHKTGTLSIDMSKTSFISLRLNNVRFSISHDFDFNGDGDEENNFGIFALCQTTIKTPPREKKSSKWKMPLIRQLRTPRTTFDGDLPDKDDSTQNEKTDWYYAIQYYDSSFGWSSIMWELTTQEGEYVQDYLSNFQYKESEKKRTSGGHGNKSNTKKKWKKDLYRGCAILKCLYAAEYIVNHCFYLDLTFGDTLYKTLN